MIKINGLKSISNWSYEAKSICVIYESDMVDRIISNINRTTSLDSKHTFACARRARVSLTLELLNVFHPSTSYSLHYDCVHEAEEQRSTKSEQEIIFGQESSNKIIIRERKTREIRVISKTILTECRELVLDDVPIENHILHSSHFVPWLTELTKRKADFTTMTIEQEVTLTARNYFYSVQMRLSIRITWSRNT